MPFASTSFLAVGANKRCDCVGPCSGYGTCSNCPPLIVLAVLVAPEVANPSVNSSKEMLQ